MSLNVGGHNISDIYVGNDKISQVFFGEDLVYTASNPAEYYLGFHPNNSSEVCTVELQQFMTEGADWSKFTTPAPVRPTFQYSYNGKIWQAYTLGTVLSIGGSNPKVVYFKGDNLSNWYGLYSEDSKTYTTYARFVLSGSVAASGNVMSLRYSDPTNTNNTTIPCIDAFFRLFDYCTSLTTPPLLPAITLTKECYDGMFRGCTSLMTAPELPATTLAHSCYNGMFFRCTSLTSAPELPATTLENSCYYGMFNQCTSLTSAPELPATTLATNCYDAMFYGCTSLTSAPALPATTLADGCYFYMFQGCTSLTSPPALPATTLAAGCYYGMFQGCTSLVRIPKLDALTIPDGGVLGTYSTMYTQSSVRANSTSSGVCNKAYRIPTSGTGTAASKSMNDMFTDLEGTGVFSPSINTVFYINVPSF